MNHLSSVQQVQIPPVMFIILSEDPLLSRAICDMPYFSEHQVIGIIYHNTCVLKDEPSSAALSCLHESRHDTIQIPNDLVEDCFKQLPESIASLPS